MYLKSYREMFEFKKKSNYFSPTGKTFLFNYISACYIAFLWVMFTLLSYHYIKNPPYLLGLSVNAFLNLYSYSVVGRIPMRTGSAHHGSALLIPPVACHTRAAEFLILRAIT